MFNKAYAGEEQSNTEEVLTITMLVLVGIFGIGTLIIYLIHLKRYRAAKKTSLLVGPVIGKPYVPFSTEFLFEYKGNEWRRSHLPEPRVFFCPFMKPISLTPYAVQKVTKIVRKLMDFQKPSKRLDDGVASDALWHRYLHPIPQSSRIVAIAMHGFTYGKDCFEFVPTRGKIGSNWFTYQMYGKDRVMVTRYVENDYTYVAGFCFFIKDLTEWGVVFPTEVLYELKKKSYFGFVAVPYLHSLGLISQKDYEADREKVRLKIWRKENYESDEEESPRTLMKRAKLVNEEETPILERAPGSDDSASLSLESIDVEYAQSPAAIEPLSPSVTPESLRGNLVPLASSEECSLYGSDRLSLNSGDVERQSNDVEL